MTWTHPPDSPSRPATAGPHPLAPAGFAASPAEQSRTMRPSQSASLTLHLSSGHGTRKQRGNMFGIAEDPSTRIVSKGLRSLRPVILALLGALVLTGTAHASGPGQTVDATAAPIGKAILQSAGAIATSGAKAVTETPTSPATPKVAPPVLGAGETPKVAPPVPGGEEAPKVAVPGGEETPKVAPPVPGGEATPKIALSPPPAARQDAATSGAAGEAAPEVPSTPIVSLTRASTTGPASVGVAAGISAAHRAGDLTCEFPRLGGRMTDSCAAGWLSTQRFLSASPLGSATAAASLAAAPSGAPAGGVHDGSAAGSPPVSPAPGPAPSGASGGSAVGASGLALSGFLTLAGLLLLGAPRAMRRLRLSCQPCLTACFVLIPERPG
jgi:hypothetical protein